MPHSRSLALLCAADDTIAAPMLRLQATRAMAIAARTDARRCTQMPIRCSSSDAHDAPAASAMPAAAASVSASAPSAVPAARTKKEKIAAKASAATAASTYHPIKGTHDALPLLASRQRACESLLASLAQSYMYSEIRTPILERTELFQRTLGEASDVVSKEMFAFEDHGTNTVLRPENTASVARALIHAGLISTTSPIQRYWYCGPMFRRERPQAGRYRQFLQFGVELLATDAVGADVEVIQMAAEALRKLGLLPYVQLQINSLGDAESRAAYVKALTAFLEARKDQLSEESQQRLARGSVLRILDSKEAADQMLLVGDGTPASPPAPLLPAYLSPKAALHFQQLQQGLRDAGVAFTLNPFLVRGLDYYAHVCFEFVLDLPAVRARVKQLGKKGVTPPAQGTVLAGGRYDGLFATLGWPATSSVPAVGWAAGLDRILLLEEMVQPLNQVRMQRLPTPVGVVLIPDAPAAAASGDADAAAAAAAATAAVVPAVATGGVTLPQAYSALCSFVRDGCRWPPAASSAAAAPSPFSTFDPTAAPSAAATPSYCVIQSFQSSMSKQLKYCTRPLSDGRGAADQTRVTLMVGSRELAAQVVAVKDLVSGAQQNVALGELAQKLGQITQQQGGTATQTNEPTTTITFEMLRDAYHKKP